MDIGSATAAFSALSQETRLLVFRLLIKAGPQGISAGEIADRLEVRQNTMSANLSVLLNAGLVKKTRHGRSITYTVNYDRLHELLGYLMEECCGGKPEQCQPVIDELVFDLSKEEARG